MQVDLPVINLDGRRYELGDASFPLADREHTQLFTHTTTRQLQVPDLALRLDQRRWDPTRCYANARVVARLGENMSLAVEFYAGWLLSEDGLPRPHAWAVLDDQVIDVTLFAPGAKIFGQVADGYCYVGCPETARHAVELLLALQKIPGHPLFGI